MAVRAHKRHSAPISSEWVTVYCIMGNGVMNQHHEPDPYGNATPATGERIREGSFDLLCSPFETKIDFNQKTLENVINKCAVYSVPLIF